MFIHYTSTVFVWLVSTLLPRLFLPCLLCHGLFKSTSCVSFTLIHTRRATERGLASPIEMVILMHMHSLRILRRKEAAAPPQGEGGEAVASVDRCNGAHTVNTVLKAVAWTRRESGKKEVASRRRMCCDGVLMG